MIILPMECMSPPGSIPDWSPSAIATWDRNGWLDHDNPAVWGLVDDIPEAELWDIHLRKKVKLINAIRERIRRRWVEERVGLGNVVAGGTMLDHSILTIGFARRFATYKRADLIFTDLERLKKLLNDPFRPLQLIFAGKAHPADNPGKQILQRIFNLARDPELGGRIAFVEDYGEELAQDLVHGVDVWLNNPRPPLEACGTSGMKAAINGTLHLSILDGWWPEGYNGRNGWAFGGDENAPDAAGRRRPLHPAGTGNSALVLSGERRRHPRGLGQKDERVHEDHRPRLQRPPHGEAILPEILPARPGRRGELTKNSGTGLRPVDQGTGRRRCHQKKRGDPAGRP